MTASSSYPFYITLDNIEGLIIGQHVYIEADYGQEEENGIWLQDGYLVTDGEQTYVWATDSSSKLVQRSVTIGAHDDEQGKTEIMEGLTGEDYIAWPDESLKVGMSVVYYDEETFETATTGAEENEDMDGGMMDDGGMYDDEGMIDDGGMMDDEGMIDDGGMMDDEGMIDDGGMDEGVIDDEMQEGGPVDDSMQNDASLENSEPTTFEKIRINEPEG